MIVLNLAHQDDRQVYIPVEQIKAVHPRRDGTAVIVEGTDDSSPWLVIETASEIAKLIAAWKTRAFFLNETIRAGAQIISIAIHPTTKGLIPEYAMLHLEQVH